MTAAASPDLDGIRSVLSRATGTGWEAAYRQDVGALLAEVERLRAESDPPGTRRVRTLLCGCPRHFEGHDTYRLTLPIRADAFQGSLKRLSCKVRTREKTKDDDGTCGQAIMLIGVEDVTPG